MGADQVETSDVSRPGSEDVSARRRFFRHKRLWWSLGILAALILLVLLAFNISPRPGALLIRAVFERNAANVKKEMEAYAPGGVASITNQQYRAGDDDARLDVYFPETADQEGVRLPTVIWTHGGAWVSGHKDDAAPYFQLIASEGYTVISLGYSLAPGKTYPTPVHQVNDALVYIQENAERFHVDVDQLVLAGDSAGAQIASQVAVLNTDLPYATELGLTPALQPEQLRGVILYCGIYDMTAFDELFDLAPGMLRWGGDIVVWAYTGRRGGDSTALQQMSSINYVTAAFPPVFISGGNKDPLTNDQSRPLAAKLEGLGVELSTLFYPPDHEPGLGHEYQFKLDNPDAQNALTQMLAFLKQHTSSLALTR